MNRALPVLVALVLSAAAVPALAQYANEYSPPKLLHEGTTSKPIVGSGTVVVQVEVHADGSHKAVKVIRSTNHGDDEAALDIAQNSAYRPAHRGTRPVLSFYDFTLKFKGNSIARQERAVLGGAPATPAEQKIAMLLSKQEYAQAKSVAESALLSSPSDRLREFLGTADAQTGDFQGAAEAFDHVPTISHQFHLIAAQSFANAAVSVSGTNPTQAMSWAQKAVALDPSTNSKYALGVAQLGNKQYADAIATLKAVHAAAFADAKTPKNARVAIDSSLLEAYSASKDTADESATSAEIKSIDPTSTLPDRVLGNSLLQAGVAAETAKDNAGALKDFQQAAALGDPTVSVTAYTQAAFLMLREEKPDYATVQGYAQKALALKPDDAQANYADGVALTGIWATKRDDATKKAALAALTKADQLAKAAGNEALSLSIEGFVKNNLGSSSAAGGGG